MQYFIKFYDHFMRIDLINKLKWSKMACMRCRCVMTGRWILYYIECDSPVRMIYSTTLTNLSISSEVHYFSFWGLSLSMVTKSAETNYVKKSQQIEVPHAYKCLFVFIFHKNFEHIRNVTPHRIVVNTGTNKHIDELLLVFVSRSHPWHIRQYVYAPNNHTKILHK